MARDTKRSKMEFEIDFEAIIGVDDGVRKTFEQDLMRGGLSLGAEMKVGTTFDDFIIGFKDITGGLTFKKIDDNLYSVSARGRYVTTDSLGNLELIKKNGDNGDLVLVDVGDSRSNYYYVNGDENLRPVIGRLVL